MQYKNNLARWNKIKHLVMNSYLEYELINKDQYLELDKFLRELEFNPKE